jgi:hypothetical protein
MKRKNVRTIGFDEEIIECYLKERPNTDGARFFKTYEFIRNKVGKQKNDKDSLVILNLSINEISRETGLSRSIVEHKIEELRNYGVLDYESGGSGTRIYFKFGKKSSYLDSKLEEAKKR